MTRTTSLCPGSSGSDSTSLEASRSASSADGGRGEALPVLDDLTHPIDRMQQVSRLHTSRRRRREREIPGVLEDPFERGAGGQHARPAEHLIQGGERGGNARSGIGHVRLATEEAEPATGLTEREQVLVADAEERSAQHADERDTVLRIAERPQQQARAARPPPIRRTRRPR